LLFKTLINIIYTSVYVDIQKGCCIAIGHYHSSPLYYYYYYYYYHCCCCWISYWRQLHSNTEFLCYSKLLELKIGAQLLRSPRGHFMAMTKWVCCWHCLILLL